MTSRFETTFQIGRILEISGRSVWIGIVVYDLKWRDALIEDLIAEVIAQVGLSTRSVITDDLSASALTSAIGLEDEGAVVLTGFEAWDRESWRALDAVRNSLERSGPIIFVLGTTAAAELSRSAPDIKSYLGSFHTIMPDSPEMDKSEVERRLGALRECYGLSDEEVVEKASSDTLPPDPHFVEWLMLIDRGDLI